MKGCSVRLMKGCSVTEAKLLQAHAIGLTSELCELYPKIRHLYLYRHPIEYLRSITSIYNTLLHPILQELVMKLSLKMNWEGFLMS